MLFQVGSTTKDGVQPPRNPSSLLMARLRVSQEDRGRQAAVRGEKTSGWLPQLARSFWSAQPPFMACFDRNFIDGPLNINRCLITSRFLLHELQRMARQEIVRRAMDC